MIMDDPNILDIDSETFRQIEIILENKSTRESLLNVIPSEYFSNNCLQLMDNESYKYEMTTAKWLLFRLGRNGVKISNFIQWLEKVDLEKALRLLKKDAPIQIIEQPLPILEVKRGAKLTMSCKAISFPLPEYQWYKGDEELLLQQESEFLLKSVDENDSGIYSCLVSKTNIETNDISWVYSNPVQVIVLEGSAGNFTLENSKLPSAVDSSLIGPENRFASGCNYTLHTDDDNSLERNERAKVTIVKQPYMNGKVSQGMSVCLHCKAKSFYPEKYQWYKNGRILIGATSKKLLLSDLYPDQNTGDMKWEYFCEVSNDHDKVFSQTAVVELKSADDTTVYYASEKYAFMVANDDYDNLEELKKPANDVADLGKLLESLEFKVFAFRNLNLTEMKNAFYKFLKVLKPGCYALFYFAGHGFEQYGQMYLQPVDCTSSYQLQESICAEYILQCLQETKPSLNILLIDACRNLPPNLKLEKCFTPPGIIYDAKMKNNTLYGYSTPFLYSSHESDSERNSFFVKYLKKYITHNKSIQDILLQVQREFESDPLVKGVQFPVIKTSLCGNRKFCDQIKIDELPTNKIICLDDIKGDYVPIEFTDLLPKVNSVFTIEAAPHLNIFITGIDIVISFYTESNISLKMLQYVELTLSFDTRDIEIQSTCITLKDLSESLKVNTKIVLFKKHLQGIHKIKVPKLIGKLSVNITELKNASVEKMFFINVEKVTEMKLSTNYLS